MARFDLSEAEWAIIEPLLPGSDGHRIGRPRLDDRRVLNAIFFVLRTGTPWRDLPVNAARIFPKTAGVKIPSSAGHARGWA